MRLSSQGNQSITCVHDMITPMGSKAYDETDQLNWLMVCAVYAAAAMAGIMKPTSMFTRSRYSSARSSRIRTNVQAVFKNAQHACIAGFDNPKAVAALQILHPQARLPLHVGWHGVGGCVCGGGDWSRLHAYLEAAV